MEICPTPAYVYCKNGKGSETQNHYNLSYCLLVHIYMPYDLTNATFHGDGAVPSPNVDNSGIALKR